MFPEERDGEPDDYEKGIVGWTYDGDAIYNSNSSNNKNNTNYNNPITGYENNFNRYNIANDIKVYYFNEYGQMLSNTIIEIVGTKIAIDKNGSCTVITS